MLLCGDPDHNNKNCPRDTHKENKTAVEEAAEETEPRDISETSTDPANQQMETEPDAAETAGATSAMDPPLSVDEANEEIATMIKAKATENKKRSIQNSRRLPNRFHR